MPGRSAREIGERAREIGKSFPVIAFPAICFRPRTDSADPPFHYRARYRAMHRATHRATYPATHRATHRIRSHARHSSGILKRVESFGSHGSDKGGRIPKPYKHTRPRFTASLGGRGETTLAVVFLLTLFLPLQTSPEFYA